MSDIFHFANQIDAVKNELDIELFLFNKNYTPYALEYGGDLASQLRAVFLYDIINDINLGAATGLRVLTIDHYDNEDNTIGAVALEDVGRAHTLTYLIEGERDDILNFSNLEHEFKRMKGIVARFTHPKDKSIDFYIVKLLPSSSISSGVAWQINGARLEAHASDVSLKAAIGNQVLITNETVYIFDQKKFVKLFNHDIKREGLLESKIKEIEANFKLSFPEGLSLTALADSSKQLTNNIIRCDIESTTQEKIIDQADKFQLALMTDDAGAIIIMDTRDANLFVNLLNDDYVASDMTEKHYLATKKKEVFDTDDKQINMGL